MADVRVVGASKDLDLALLNTWIGQRERLMGPVVGVGAGQTPEGQPETAVSLDLDQPRPKKNFAKVKLKVGGAAVVAPDQVLVCEGQAYISGVLSDVFLVRKKT
ncbi:hypothetical protein [Phenylobacterium sp.]|uniref:hypothetical protein n=1 Tax=Phenylobacterium sp. TaxID=1871053 RepID=UPI003BAC86F6